MRLKYILGAAALMLFLTVGPVHAQTNKNSPDAPMQSHTDHRLQYFSPAKRWDEGLPLGNGMQGALVWGDGKPLNISLNRADLWDLRPVPEFDHLDYAQIRHWKDAGDNGSIGQAVDVPYYRDAPTKLPGARLELTLPNAPTFREGSLDIEDAVAHMSWADGTRMSIVQHATQPVGMLEMSGTQQLPSIRLVAPGFDKPEQAPTDRSVNQGTLSALGYPAPIQTSGANWQAFVQEGSEGFRYAVYVSWRPKASSWQMAWSMASSFEGADPLALARTRVDTVLQSGFEGPMTTHRAWWHNYWSQSHVALPDAELEKLWYLNTYLFGSTARRGAPPISLQAVWTADEGKLPPWKGDYHNDLNTQLSYWPTYTGNHLEEGLSFIDWLWETRAENKRYTQSYWKMPGLNVPGVVDLRSHPLGGWAQYTFSATVSCWLAQNFYQHWRYSGDRQFLHNRAYPYLKDVATFVEAVTAEKDAAGRRTLPLSSSPELNDNSLDAWFKGTTNYDLSLMRWLLGATAELADEEALPQDAARWRRVLSELPPLALGDDGGLLVAPDVPIKESHRHFSWLMAIFPLGIVDTSTPAGRRTVDASLRDLEAQGTRGWCGYSFSWLGNMKARIGDGEGAQRALRIYSESFTSRNGFHLNGDQSGQGFSGFTYRPFTLEGNFAALAGVQEMLLQSEGGTIRVFPAIPSTWRDASFETLRAEGGFLVSATRREGRTERVEIVATQNGTCRWLSPFTNRVQSFKLKKGQRRVFTVST